MILVAGSEPAELRAIGTTTNLTEKYGVDVMFESQLGLIGIQRKYYTDLYASIGDRLSREVRDMQLLGVAILIVEGSPRWTPDGALIHQQVKWSRDQYERLLFSIRLKRIWVLHSRDLADTIRLVQSLYEWSQHDHLSLERRPYDLRDEIDQKAARQRWVLMSVDGVGPVQARAIQEKYGLPVRLTVTQQELESVVGIGAGRARKIVEAFGG